MSPNVAFHLLILGTLTGLVYALLGVGLAVTYKTSRVFNLAIGQMGALAALFIPVLVIKTGMSYWPALVVALCVAAATGAFTDVVVIRTLARSPRLLVMVATLGLAQLFYVAEIFLPHGGLGSHLYPVPFHATVRITGLRLGAGYLVIVIVVPVVVAAMTAFFQRTTIGLASRAAADNEDAAQLTGIRVRQVSTVMWTVAGLLAGVAGILLGPTQLVGTSDQLIGPTLLLRALTAALLGGLTNLPQVFAGGMAIGIVEAVVRYQWPAGGVLDLVMLGIVVASLLLRRDLRHVVRSTVSSSWSLTGTRPSLPRSVMESRNVRRFRSGGFVVIVAGAVLLGPLLNNGGRVLATTIVVYALMGLSVVVLTGYAGQLSLGQVALVEFGAFVAGRLVQLGYPSWVALSYAVFGGILAAIVLGIPAVRARGEFLAATTLAFAVASQTWLPQQHWLVNTSSQRLPRPVWLGVSWVSELRYYWLCIAILVLAVGLVTRIRVSGLGRRFIAVRDNERAAASLGVPPWHAKLTAFMLAGVLAAGSGFFYGALLGGFSDPQTFLPAASLTLVAFVVLGGVNSATGAVLGAALVFGLGYFLTPVFRHHVGASAAQVLSGVGLVAIVLTYREGIVGKVFDVRDRLYRSLAAPASGGPTLAALASGGPTLAAPASASPTLAALHTEPDDRSKARVVEPSRARPSVDGAAGNPALACEEIVFAYGGNHVLAGVSLSAAAGEIVGLVGPNGAGKTTLFDILSGHERPRRGRVYFQGQEITWLPPERRAGLGIARTFQQARLFDGLTVLDCVKLALERTNPTETVPALFGFPPARQAERTKTRRADEIIDYMGLGMHRDRAVTELSTGLRRLVELSMAVALEPTVLLLDEPTAGIAQREVEAFATVLRDVASALDATIVLIEHDLPLVAAVSDRLYVLATGLVIAEGPPEMIRRHPAVIAAYLGTDETVIARSGRHKAGVRTAHGRRAGREAQRDGSSRTTATVGEGLHG
jgi:ABC-type branched-subunit amino acid transport system ATPase component/ABC-type branched-subunit amino acid transport system permease subunit